MTVEINEFRNNGLNIREEARDRVQREFEVLSLDNKLNALHSVLLRIMENIHDR